VEQVAHEWEGQWLGPKPLNSRSVAYESARRVKSGAGVLFGFTVYNSNANAQFVQVFDSQTLPANGAAPEVFFRVPATADKELLWIPGRTFTQGCWICNSSTGPTKTLGAADCYFDAQYV
jgi:hypothetical protein